MTKQFSMELAGRTLMVEVGRVAAVSYTHLTLPTIA